jgi:putative cell wall-binding protein
LAGANRYATNLEIIREAFVKAAGTSKLDTTVLVCSGNEYADSLSASATKKPILLVDKVMINGTYLKYDQQTYLKSYGIKDAIIIGGTGAVIPEVGIEIKTVLGKTSIERIAGANRYETSARIAKRFFTTSQVSSVTFAYGLDFPDGLAAGPLAIKNNAPLILIAGTDSDIVSNGSFFTSDNRVKYAKEYIGSLTGKTMKYSIVGGTGVISKILAGKLTGITEQ